MTLYEEDVPTSRLTTITTVSTWTWFEWGFYSPSYFGEPKLASGNRYHISRLIYSTGKGIYCDLVFPSDGGNVKVEFTETSGESEEV